MGLEAGEVEKQHLQKQHSIDEAKLPSEYLKDETQLPSLALAIDYILVSFLSSHKTFTLLAFWVSISKYRT